MVTEKTRIGTIDITPTWSSLVPALVALIENSNHKGRQVAMDELKRMAELADAYVKIQKASKGDD